MKKNILRELLKKRESKPIFEAKGYVTFDFEEKKIETGELGKPKKKAKKGEK